MAGDNRTIAKFQITGIPQAPRGMPQVEVTFDIDANGILHVSAKDKASNKEQKIRIEASSGLSDTEIDRMVKQAEEHASEDEARRGQVEQRNQLDGLVYKVEKDSAEWVDKLPAETKGRLDAAVESGKQALRAGDTDGIAKALEELNSAYSAAGAAMYQSQQQAQPEGGQPGAQDAQPEGGATPEDVVEADYEIVDENK
jgi:molecular chaperone DnaK